MKTYIIAALACLLTISAMAEKSKSRARKRQELSLWDRLKASPYSLTYIMTLDSARDDNADVKGFEAYHDFLFSYVLDSKNDFRILTEWQTNYQSESFNDNDYGKSLLKTGYAGTEFRYQRIGLTNQDDHGLNTNFQMRYFHSNDDDKYAGIVSPRFYVNRSLTSKLSLDGIIRPDFYVKESDNETNDDNIFRLRLYLTPTIAVTDKFSFGATFRYQHIFKDEGAATRTLSQVDFQPNGTFNIDAYNSVGFLLSIPVVASGDNVTFVRQAQDAVLYEVFYILAAF